MELGSSFLFLQEQIKDIIPANNWPIQKYTLLMNPGRGGGSEIFLKGVQPITRAEDHAEWIPVPELKTSSAWGILFFISGTNESRGIFPIPPSVGPPTAVFAPYSL
jgi:hypothetical protein